MCLLTTFSIPCTLRTTGSLYRLSPPRTASAHTTTVLLYSSVAGTCKKNILPTWLAVISGLFSTVNNDPLSIQDTTPVVALQLKVAADPSVALTDVGVLTKAGMITQENTHTDGTTHIKSK